MIFILIIVSLLITAHIYLYVCNPFSRWTIFKQPYSTTVYDGKISYQQNYDFIVHGSKLAGWLGYYRSGFLILINTFFGGKPIAESAEPKIIAEIHRRRFDPRLPYLISGDQFSVLYPRNMGVFYNQLIDPQAALSKKDLSNRQRIYLQSVLVAIDGLSASSDPRTTIVPIGRKSAVLTQVHPGGVGSDQVYGLLYAIDCLRRTSETTDAVKQLLEERRSKLKYILHSYLSTVRDPDTGLVLHNLHMASARDGVVRSSSFYDNIILWKTLQLAGMLGLRNYSDADSQALKRKIKQTYWNAKAGFYNDDVNQLQFSADFLIGYPTKFFDLDSKQDLQRSQKIIDYIERSGLAKPFPIKYQKDTEHKVPLFVKLAVPTYGSTAIWSYWGAQYITLLLDVYSRTKDTVYKDLAKQHLDAYAQTIVRDGGFAETFDETGAFMQRGIYKSIRVTGWIVQYEHAVTKLRNLT